MTNFLLGSFLIWLPKIFLWAAFMAVLFLYVFRNKFIDQKTSFFYKLSFLIPIGFGIIYAFLLSIVQYFVWNGNRFTKMLANSADETSSIFNYKYGYFLHYISVHFWLSVLISIGISFIFYLFLGLLKKYRERFFETGEVELGFALALIVGWPNFVIFIPLVFIFIVLLAVFRMVFLKEAYTTLGWPMLFAALVVLIWGDILINILNLGALRV